MEEEYRLILNIEGAMLKILKRSLNQENYEIIAEDQHVLMIGKTKSSNRLDQNEIDLILSMARRQRGNRILVVDITKVVQYVLDVKDKMKQIDDGKFRWMMRQSFVKALSEKSIKEEEEYKF